MRSAAFAFLLLAMFFLILRTSVAAPFICNAKPRSTCQSLIGYVPTNDTTFAAVKSLFGVKSIRALYSSNGLPPSSQTASRIAAGSTVRVPVPCACSSGSGSTSGRPIYVIKAGDGLDAIARNVFNGFVIYQEIATANNITDPNKIEVGQRLLIPLPCSCDPEDGERVVHYAHLVVPDSTVSSIADEFGVSPGLLLRINGITDPKTLQAGQVLDVPLRACSSMISNSSIDRNLLVPNGSYALTAKNCIQCRCSSTTWQLDCLPIEAISHSSCPSATCGSLSIGNTSSISACETASCDYAGYTASGILTVLTNHSTCNGIGGAAPPPSQNAGSAMAVHNKWRRGAGIWILLGTLVLLWFL